MEENTQNGIDNTEVTENTEIQENNTAPDDKNGDDMYEEISREEFKKLLKKAEKKGKRKAFLTMLIILVILIFVIVGGLFSIVGNVGNGITDKYFNAKAKSLWAIVEKYYLWDEDIDIKKAQDGMYKSMIESLEDPYSTYYTKEEFDELNESYTGEYSGIGAYISQNINTKELYISKPMPGSPAEEIGLLANDYIYEVDGENVVGQDINLVVSKIKGPEGTTVDIGVKHDNKGEIETYTVERRTIEVAMIEYEMLEDGIGKIWILEFEGKTFAQFEKAYNDLKSQGMKGLIVDLRDNPGGDVEIVTKLSDMFLDEGMIFYLKDKNGKTEEVKSDAACEKLPIVILTNENSASASEIFTGALKDRGVATVVGKNTFGKGIVQSVLALPDGTGIKITEAEYYLPNDECIHGVGIAPDYEVDLDIAAYRKDGTDAQKDKAIEVMKELLKK